MARRKSKWLIRFKSFLEAGSPAYWHHLDLRPVSDLDDEGLGYALTHVKGIYMLDLNETEITDEGIKLLPKLEYVNELRLKGIAAITNDCVADLNMIKGLNFLHLKNTSVTIDGLLKLDKLNSLKTLMFSTGEEDDIKAKMLQLRSLLPGCEFVVNSKGYEFEDEGM